MNGEEGAMRLGYRGRLPVWACLGLAFLLGAAAGAPGAAAQPVSETTVSYLREEFRATAGHRGRPPLLAEAMVDADVEIRGVSGKGKLLTLTAEEALKHKVADLRAPDLPALLPALNLAGAKVRRVSETWAESLVRFLTRPVMSSRLMTIGLLGIIIEVRTPASAFQARRASSASTCSSGGITWCGLPVGRFCSCWRSEWASWQLSSLFCPGSASPGFWGSARSWAA
jgi:hypothetical protein